MAILQSCKSQIIDNLADCSNPRSIKINCEINNVDVCVPIRDR